MAASCTITVNIPTSDYRADEVMWINRALLLVAPVIRRDGGRTTSGNITADNGMLIGTWSYTPMAPS
jgi:hypothetical protein